VQRVDDPRGFHGRPAGHYLIARQCLVWCHSPTLAGTAAWGRLGVDDMRAVTSFWDHDVEMAERYDTVDDLSAVEELDPAGFEALVGYVRAMLPRYAQRIRRQAMVRGQGVPAAVVEGFYPMLGATHTYAVFTSLRDAFAWLERDDVAAVIPEVEAVIAREVAADPQRRALRAWLDRNLREPTIELAAAALATSTRTLQRHLADGGTSFRDEVQRARIEAARRMLATGDDKVDTIAQQVGFSASSHLARAFRVATGEAPAEFRARHR
jgi:AraC-like DNA-binding protein